VLGCDLAPGFSVGGPMPLAELAGWLVPSERGATA
jgi:hypothetical protein